MWASDNRSDFRVDGGKLFAFVAMKINHCLELGARAWHGVGLLFLRGMLPHLSGPIQNPTNKNAIVDNTKFNKIRHYIVMIVPAAAMRAAAATKAALRQRRTTQTLLAKRTGYRCNMVWVCLRRGAAL